MKKRVVITGMGVVAPNGVGLNNFLEALKKGESGIRLIPEYANLKFSCQVAGIPRFTLEDLRQYVPETVLHGLKTIGIGYGVRAALDAWTDAGNPIESDQPLWDTGCVFGSSVADTEVMKAVIGKVDAGEARKLGSRIVEQVMASGVTAYISGRLGFGNRVISTSAACATGTQALMLAYEYIRDGKVERMLTGSSEHVDPYIFGSFDSMRVLSRKFNDQPERASRPMSRTAGGFVPGSGAGALVLEELGSAQARGARIYAEVLGGATNSGGQRKGGSMTAPASEGVIRCITQALADAGIEGNQIDLVAGHLTATMADKLEVANWATALGCERGRMPKINSVKGMIGHCLSAAGSIECVASVLQIVHGFVHPNLNLEDPEPEIVETAGAESLPTAAVKASIKKVAKANFGFGDVNTCLIFSKFEA